MYFSSPIPCQVCRALEHVPWNMFPGTCSLEHVPWIMLLGTCCLEHDPGNMCLGTCSLVHVRQHMLLGQLCLKHVPWNMFPWNMFLGACSMNDFASKQHDPRNMFQETCPEEHVPWKMFPATSSVGYVRQQNKILRTCILGICFLRKCSLERVP